MLRVVWRGVRGTEYLPYGSHTKRPVKSRACVQGSAARNKERDAHARLLSSTRTEYIPSC